MVLTNPLPIIQERSPFLNNRQRVNDPSDYIECKCYFTSFRTNIKIRTDFYAVSVIIILKYNISTSMNSSESIFSSMQASNISAMNASIFDNKLEQRCSPGDLVYDLHLAQDDFLNARFFYSKPERLFISTFFPLLLAFGLIGNGAFLVVVAKVPGMRTVTNMYLINLALCDILFIVFSLNDIFLSYLYSPIVRTKLYQSSLSCASSYSIIYVTHFTADCLIVFMTFERYAAICKPLKHRLMSTKRRTYKLVFLSWTAGIAYALPVVPRFASVSKTCILWPEREVYQQLPTSITSCEAVHPIFNWFSFIAQAIPYSMAFLMNTILYLKIIMRLNQRVKDRKKLQNAATALTEKNARFSRNKVALLLIVTGTVYFLCYLPYIVIRLNVAVLEVSKNRYGFELGTEQFWILFWIVVGLAVTNSVINPVIYSVLNLKYRRAFIQVFSCSLGFKCDNNKQTRKDKNAATSTN